MWRCLSLARASWRRSREEEDLSGTGARAPDGADEEVEEAEELVVVEAGMAGGGQGTPSVSSV